MKKTLILSLALALGITTVCAASPLKNYNAGKVAVDLGLNVPTSNTYEGHSVGSKKTSPYAGITVGLAAIPLSTTNGINTKTAAVTRSKPSSST